MVLAVQMAELVGRLLPELHVGAHPFDEQAAEGLLFGEGAARPRREGEDRARLVEHEDGANGGCLALRRRQPALRQLRQALRIGDGKDDVVLLDDALVEAVGLFTGQPQSGLEDRLLAKTLDLKRGPKREVSEDSDGHQYCGQQHEAREPLAHARHFRLSGRWASMVGRQRMTLIRSGSVTTPRVATNSANCSAMYVSAFPSDSVKG